MDNRYTRTFNKLKSRIEVINQKENISRVSLYTDAAWCFLRYGTTPNEYLGWNFWKLSASERKKFYTARDHEKYEYLYNDYQYAHVFDNKVDFNTTFSHFIQRDWLYAKNATKEQIESFLSSHARVMVKPIGLSSGRGIHVFRGESIEDLVGGEYLLEEFIQQHPALSELNPSTVNSIRVYALKKRDDSTMFLSASIRVGGKDADVDNYHAGGVGYPIDILGG